MIRGAIIRRIKEQVASSNTSVLVLVQQVEHVADVGDVDGQAEVNRAEFKHGGSGWCGKRSPSHAIERLTQTNTFVTSDSLQRRENVRIKRNGRPHAFSVAS